MAKSLLQENYILREKRKKQFIHSMRILLFFLFLVLWEVSARLRWIDSFIFSSLPDSVYLPGAYPASPSVFPYRNHPGRNTYQFPAGDSPQLTFFCFFMAFSPALCHFGTLPRSFKQPSQVCSGSSSDRLAGSQYANDYCRRYVCGNLRFHYQSVYRLSGN